MSRRRLVALVLLGLLPVAASVSYTAGYTLEIVDSEGRPQRAYALYNHQGQWLNPVHPVSYNATQTTVTRGDDNGRLTIPAAFHVHLPFPVQTHPSLWIDMVYVPRLHNAGGRIGGGYAASAAGAWEMDATWHRAVVFDLSDSPERWQGTLSNLSFFLRPILSGPPRDFDPATAATLVELVEHFRAEYTGFLARHGDTPRPRPPMPATLFSDDEKRRWIEMVDTDLGQRPTWGMEIRRLYETELSVLADVEAELKRQSR
jgi:hypothetical protein